MRGVRRGLVVCLAMTGGAGPAFAHAFGTPYAPPVPLAAFLAGAAVVVALSFVVMALALRPGHSDGYPRFDLMRLRPVAALYRSPVAAIVRAAAAGLFLALVSVGFIGAQDTLRNPLPTAVWVVTWVGLVYAAAALGEVWTLVNPWPTLFAWGAALAGRAGLAAPAPRPYPGWLGAWPAVVFLLVFGWMEMVWEGGERPATLATVILAYGTLTLAGMAVFGREVWLARGEFLTLVFALVGRFAPLAIGVADGRACRACASPECAEVSESCLGCPACRARAPAAAIRWWLRPPAVGLVSRAPLSASMAAFAVVLLANVSFDGFRETPAWAALLDAAARSQALRAPLLALQGAGVDLLALFETLGLVGAAGLFFAAFAVVAWTSGRIAGRGEPWAVLAGRYVLSLLPIAIAYHVAHYLSFLLLAGQLVVPLAGDPLGLGWDLFGSATRRLATEVVSARMVWYVAVPAVVLGHVAAVAVAHIEALRAYGNAAAARLSQLPLVALMVGYTMTSLWILAQPVVATAD